MQFKKNMTALMTALLLITTLFTNYVTAFAVEETETTYTAAPKQIVCTPHGDLKTQVGFAWVTEQNGSTAKAQVMRKEAGDTWESAITYTGTAGNIDKWRWHKVTVTGLSPDTTYVYRVGDETYWSEACEFTTAPEDGSDETYTFIQVNDTQASNLAGFQAGQEAMEKAIERFPDFKFISHGGDAVSSGGNEYQWATYFDTTKNVLRKTVYAGVIGNHENENYNTDTPPRYQYRFNYDVADTATASRGMYYSFDYGNTHFTVLHGKDFRDPDQITWLKYDLAKNSKRWNIVLIHQGLYSNGPHSMEDNIIKARNVFAPILNDQFNVDMIFQAHEHIYSRTYPIRYSQPLTNTPVLTNQTVDGLTGVTLWENPKGTVHQLNNACGKKVNEPNPNAETKWFVPVNGALAFQPHKPTYAGVTVTENEIVNSAYYIDGGAETLIESQGIRKTTPQVNPPRNVTRTYENGSLKIAWDAPEAQTDQTVEQYVVYDDNNAFTTKNATYFVSADGQKSVSIPMSESVYDNTNFVVKAIGMHSVSNEGILEFATDPDNPKTSLWIKSVSDSKNRVYENLKNGITEGSYATIVNNKASQVKVVCVVSTYDTNNQLVGFYPLGSLDIEAGSSANIDLPLLDTTRAKQLKLSAYVNSVDPLKPGGSPLILNKTTE